MESEPDVDRNRRTGIRRRLVIALVALAAIVIGPPLLDLANAPFRDSWTYCFGDRAPAMAQAYLDKAEASLSSRASGGNPNGVSQEERLVTATVQAKSGQLILDAAAARWPYKILSYQDLTLPPDSSPRPDLDVALLRAQIRDYRRQCYPVPEFAKLPWLLETGIEALRERMTRA